MEANKYIQLILDHKKMLKDKDAYKLCLEAIKLYPDNAQINAIYNYFVKHYDKNRFVNGSPFNIFEIIDYLLQIQNQSSEEIQAVISFLCEDIPSKHTESLTLTSSPYKLEEEFETLKNKVHIIEDCNNEDFKPCIDKLKQFITIEEQYINNLKIYKQKLQKEYKNKKIKKAVLYSILAVCIIIIGVLVILI